MNDTTLAPRPTTAAGTSLKLHWSPVSPYVRKVMALAHETGLAGRIEPVLSPVQMITPNMRLMEDNPLGKVPTLVLPDGRALFDSAVICEYLDGLHGGRRFFPEEPSARLQALGWHSLGNGMADILLLWYRENLRPVEKRMQELLDIFRLKVAASIPVLEREADALERTPPNIGHLAIACSLDYIDFRFPELV